MARLIDNFCVECDVCRHCGRDKDVIHYECDSCDADNIDGETKIYSDGAYHYCLTCLLRKHMLDFATDMVEEYGEEWADENYEVVGEMED